MAITDKGDNTGNIFIDVLAAYSFLDVGGDRNITYYFEQGGNTSAHNWSFSDKASWQIALLAWADVANITVQEVFSPDADLREAWVSSDFMTASHGLGPGGVPLVSFHRLPQISSGSFNGEYNRGYTGTVNSPPHWGPSGPAIGSSGFGIFVQTIGQGLGLVPPFGTDQLANEPLFPGVTDAGNPGDFGYNQMVYTVLSPNRGQYISAALNYGYPVTPMAFDIAAIQFLYGPNTTFHSGSDGYGLPDVNDLGTVWRCIWDTGGTDTISYDGKKNATIDLRPATLIFGDPIAGGANSKVDGIFGGFTIANGVVIENASGGSGNDTLTGNSADNVLNGNAGDDTAVYLGNRSNYTLQNLGDRVLVSGPDGNDTLFSIEHVRFADTTINFNAATSGSFNPLFDAQYYNQTYPDVAHAGVDAKQHYDTSGWREGRDPDAFFSTSFYLASNFDVRKSGVNPLDQYYQTGWKEGRDPSPNFDTKLYLLHNPDVAAARIDPLEHYLHHGIAEGRAAYAAIGSVVGGFDAEYYVIHNPDVAAAGVDPLAHFNSSGWREGRNPNALFDTAGYLAHYTDVAAAGVNPLQHYETYGWHEGRDPSLAFDTLGYLAAYPDVAAAKVNPLDHYLMNGIYEGRATFGDAIWH
jgi:serralysin